MHRITLTIILLIAATCADAAFYQKKDGTNVDPIKTRFGRDLIYSGNNLEPGADLTGAGLRDADLQFADLSYADMTGADLRFTYLDYADLTDAFLTGADLQNADLQFADLSYADLTGADLYDATLFYTDMEGADLTNANLRTADLRFADLSYADLSGADLQNGDGDFYYNNATWTDAFYYTDNEPIWASSMDAAWRTSVGILALAPTSSVPEPSTLILALIGLALLPRKRRR
ncbi:MAG: pentapeptide repeat-containing protein [Planctomycetota bacterium]|nr:pentapeptide repeat-containing protein [Planctomycetota bacterium]